ncbi:MAG TPA: hypothetical protein VNZ43_04280 [Sphingomonadaceae bacterium]|nr:hypothetical protein [Sphingomonadaceae bacterium]
MRFPLLLTGLAALVLGGAAMAQAPAVATPPPIPTDATAGADLPKLQAARRVVREGWEVYDKDDDGSLSPLEFGTWVMAAQGEDVRPARRGRRSKRSGLSAVKILNATGAAFNKADANRDRSVSRDELVAFLAG